MRLSAAAGGLMRPFVILSGRGLCLQRPVPSLCSIMQDPGPGNIHSNHTFSGYGHVARVCLVQAINLGRGFIFLLKWYAAVAAVCTAFSAVQCYLFAAVAAHHEAAELAPGARSEEHEADGAAAH